ncbi:phosphotransferase family protein [Halosimplex amylolyticum]|uniref:phosphotransferase family protein n=1 Tax=Halosimplex amylolyticum TaxID=3396616 RepID=UPI003F54E44E
MTDSSPAVETATLVSFLSDALGEPVTETEVIHDGLNLSLAISTETAAPAYVLRRPNEMRQADSFNDVTQEYGVMDRLRASAVPVPEPVVVCEDESVIGDPFLVMEHVDGEAVPLGSDLPERLQNPTARGDVASLLIDALADLHSLDVDEFTGVCERRPLRDQLDDVVAQLDEATSATGRESPVLWDVADWLRSNVPSDSATAVVHGDFRPGNVLFAGADRPEISAVLDWETAFLGDPLTELGYLLLRWRDDGDPTPSLGGLEARYGDEKAIEELRETNEHGLAPFTNRPGSPSRRELVDRYEAATGIDFEHDRFYRAFAAFVLATVWEDIHRHRVEAGAASDLEPHADYMASLARNVADGEFPL